MSDRPDRQNRPKQRQHPYVAYETSPLWKPVQDAIHDLIKNGDLQLMTPLDDVVGCVCKRISDSLLDSTPRDITSQNTVGSKGKSPIRNK